MNDFGDISNNAADFSRSLMAIADYVEGSFEKVIRKAMIDLYRAIVTETPVDTGRAKASWGLDIVPSNYVAPEKEYSDEEIKQIVSETVSDFKFSIHDSTVFIYNNLEYIEGLEDGDSTQKPAGMVTVSLAAFTAHFNNSLREYQGLRPT